MSSYTPPIRDVRFVLTDLLDIESYSSLPAFAAVDGELIDSIIEEAGRFCAEVIAPINQVGDREGCTRHADGTVTTPAGFPDAYAQYRDAGWGALAMPEEFGGQGLPHVLGTVVEEFLNSSCHAFNMYTGSIIGAVLTLAAKGSDELKADWLQQIVSGEYLATMALTEAQAGTDLGLIRTRAEPNGDGTYAIIGEKIFCSGGEHDLTENIVHLVLAKLPDAPQGTRGISLFLVPKILADGTRNTVGCGAIEHKMGIRASATCVMNFDGAKGWLVGAENEGLAAMFIMMNSTRLSCGNQGLGHAEHAYQKAASYALERKQGRAPGSGSVADPLIVHPDVRRMLMDARAFTEGFRALVLWTALQIDLSHGAATESERAEADQLVGLLTPVLKAYGTDRGFETTVAMQQIYGGHGYIAEWGIEQIVRDARVAMLYEGANGVQALDLAGRKVARDGGVVLERFLAMVDNDCSGADAALDFISAPLGEAIREVREAARSLMTMAKSAPNDLGAGSYAFLQMIGVTAIGWMWLRLAKAALPDRESPFCAAKLVTARHYALHSLPQVPMLRQKVEAGAEVLMAIPAEEFLRS